MPIQQSALKNPTVASIAMRRVGRGGGGGDDTREDDDDDNEDHNNNTTIEQCTGERGADDDGGDRQLTFGDVVISLGRRFGCGGGLWQRTAVADEGCQGSSRGGDFSKIKNCTLFCTG